jgi:hypothetical protein
LLTKFDFSLTALLAIEAIWERKPIRRFLEGGTPTSGRARMHMHAEIFSDVLHDLVWLPAHDDLEQETEYQWNSLKTQDIGSLAWCTSVDLM